MLVRERMTPNPLTVHPETSYDDALSLIREKKIRRLPVIDKQGHLVGIVVEKDLLFASPSPATSLSVFEIHYLLAKLLVKEIMIKKVFAVDEECPLEEAARIMVDHKIGSLPVLRGEQLVGIITETDIFGTLAEVLGGRTPGLRITVRVPNKKGMIASLTAEIARQGGNIISLATSWGGGQMHEPEVTFKLQDVNRADVIPALEKAGATIVDVREITTAYEPQIIGPQG
ncbi:MAG: CBS and ACT domain-containing protein [Anaerolineae bacterium]